jgi:hypothetical protein
MGFFCWAGMDLPFTGVAFTGRWFILAVAAVAGFVMWMRQTNHTYTSFHLVALFCVTAALVSAMVSADPATAVLKTLSLFLLFAYGAGGARLAATSASLVPTDNQYVARAPPPAEPRKRIAFASTES